MITGDDRYVFILYNTENLSVGVSTIDNRNVQEGKDQERGVFVTFVVQ